MSLKSIVVLAFTAGVAAAVSAPPAHAADLVTYEIVSETIPTVAVEYVDASGRKLLESVSVPWRSDVTLDDARGPTGRGAQLRADWRPIAGPSKWVTVRIYRGAELLCQNTIDVGNATCYGNTPHKS